MRTSRFAILILGMICLSAASGCIMYDRVTPGVAGRLVDTVSGEPIGQAPITVNFDDLKVKLISSSDGSFAVKPRYWLHLWIAGELAYIPPVVEVVAEGYYPYKIRGDDSRMFNLESDYVQLGNVLLRKQPRAAANALSIHWGESVGGLQAGIAAVTDRATSQRDLRVRVLLKNVGDKPVDVFTFTGLLAEDHGLPVFVPKKGELPMQGIPVPEGTDLEKASHR